MQTSSVWRRVGLVAIATLGLGVAVGCATPASYVSNVYRRGDQLYVQKCLINTSNDKPDPNDCRVEPVGELPANMSPAPPPPSATVTPR